MKHFNTIMFAITSIALAVNALLLLSSFDKQQHMLTVACVLGAIGAYNFNKND